jgi:hypothetical protein
MQLAQSAEGKRVDGILLTATFAALSECSRYGPTGAYLRQVRARTTTGAARGFECGFNTLCYVATAVVAQHARTGTVILAELIRIVLVQPPVHDAHQPTRICLCTRWGLESYLDTSKVVG